MVLVIGDCSGNNLSFWDILVMAISRPTPFRRKGIAQPIESEPIGV